MPFASALAAGSSDGLCGRCRSGVYRFERARAFGLYRHSLRALILRFKYGRRERLSKSLAHCLEEVWKKSPEFAEAKSPLLVPVPLHASRERQRGFNQAELLASSLRRRLKTMAIGNPPAFEPHGLVRFRATPPQTGLDFKERRENVHGVFRALHPERLRGRTVVLVDDVMTTGATLSACAEAAWAAGAQGVLALVVARAAPAFPETMAPDADAEVDDLAREWA